MLLEKSSDGEAGRAYVPLRHFSFSVIYRWGSLFVNRGAKLTLQGNSCLSFSDRLNPLTGRIFNFTHGCMCLQLVGQETPATITC